VFTTPPTSVPAKRALIEQYNGVLVIIPTSELPYYRRPADRRRERFWSDGTYKKLRPWAETIMSRITADVQEIEWSILYPDR
jgi:hypothetical protein